MPNHIVLDHVRTYPSCSKCIAKRGTKRDLVIVEGKLTLASFSNAFTSHDGVKRCANKDGGATRRRNTGTGKHSAELCSFQKSRSHKSAARRRILGNEGSTYFRIYIRNLSSLGGKVGIQNVIIIVGVRIVETGEAASHARQILQYITRKFAIVKASRNGATAANFDHRPRLENDT